MQGSKDQKRAANLQPTLNKWGGEASLTIFVTDCGLLTIAIHILPNISESKRNQTMKLGQLIEYNKRNIFLQKLCGK